MATATAQQLLLSEDDLEESFFDEEPSAAFDPVFLSGDESGRFLTDIVNMLTHGSHPETEDHASALFTNTVGSVVFHNVTQFGDQAGRRLFQDILTALDSCSSYRIELNDGAQYDVTKIAVEPLQQGAVSAVVVRWLTVADPYRLEGSWAVVAKDDILSFINTRSPDKTEIHRLAQVSLDRISSTMSS